MDKKTRSRVQGIAIFIVFLAIATTIIDYKNRENKTPRFDFKQSQRDYRDLKFINKAEINFAAQNVIKAQTEISGIINELGVKQIRKQIENSYGAYLFSVPQNKLPQVLERLRNFGVIGSHIEQIDTSLVNMDFPGEAARLQAYEREQTDLNAVRFPTDTQNRRKEVLHSLLQQSRLNLDKLKDADNVLLYIALTPIQNQSSALITIKNMGFSFLSWLGIYTVGIVIVYFGTKLLMYFLAALGIKGIGAGGAGGSYQYGSYGSYAERNSGKHGHTGSKRKVKRVYKDKHTTPTSKEADKTS